MCDTLGRIFEGYALFGKNSDRSPNEPQVAEYYPAREPAETMLRVTYRTIPQARRTYAVLLSRPTWMWGAEMGVNEHGVCIGNEAVFTRGAYGKDGLTGMDLVRLALERADSAEAARDCIIELLERYGQGGNCGFDHKFYYDNAFLIMDRKQLFVLETAGKHWVYRETDRASISNRLSIGTDGTAYSDAPCDFKKRYTEPVYTYFSGSAKRKQQTGRCLDDMTCLSDVFSALRSHADRHGGSLAKHSVGSACMHAGGLVGDHTTASMAVRLADDDAIDVYLTGGSLPCVSLYKPWRFGTEPTAPVFAAGDLAAEADWLLREKRTRSYFGKRMSEGYYAARDALETAWLSAAKNADDAAMAQLSAKALEEELAFYADYPTETFSEERCSHGYHAYWKKKNALLGCPRDEKSGKQLPR